MRWCCPVRCCTPWCRVRGGVGMLVVFGIVVLTYLLCACYSSWCMFVDVRARRRGCSRHCSCCRCSSVNDVVANVGGRAGAVHPFAAVFVGVVGPLPLLFIRS